MSTSNTYRTGMSLGSVLFLIFLVLKLVGVIDWSWWWVTAPIWISVIIALVCYFVVWLVLKHLRDNW